MIEQDSMTSETERNKKLETTVAQQQQLMSNTDAHLVAAEQVLSELRVQAADEVCVHYGLLLMRAGWCVIGVRSSRAGRRPSSSAAEQARPIGAGETAPQCCGTIFKDCSGRWSLRKPQRSHRKTQRSQSCRVSSKSCNRSVTRGNGERSGQRTVSSE